MRGNADIDFAYKYPFSNEAKAVIDELQITRIDQKYLAASRSHITAAIEGELAYKNTSMTDMKADYLVTYVYSRMILSAMKDPQLIGRYSSAEAKRSAQALSESDMRELERIAKELGATIEGEVAEKDDTAVWSSLKVGFSDFLKYSSKAKGIELVNQRLSAGSVLLNKTDALKLFEEAMKGEISKGLPISANLLPKEITEFSKTLKTTIKVYVAPAKYSKTDNWVEKLLATPIADIRHRTVNLILAPYLVNTKGMSVDQATKIICEYIERCKLLDPATRVNERYVRYQCDYAKKRGLKVLSLDRAKELLGSALDINVLN
jgi:Primase X